MNRIIKIGKKGGARWIASELAKIRKTPIPREVFEIIENFNKIDKQSDKKSAKPSNDLGL